MTAACESGSVIGAFLTERLALRPVDSDDLELLSDLNGDAQVMEFITGRASSIDETAAELEASVGARWLTFARSDGQFLGWVGAVPTPQGDQYDVGWRFKHSAWGHGYAKPRPPGPSSPSSLPMEHNESLLKRWRSTHARGR